MVLHSELTILFFFFFFLKLIDSSISVERIVTYLTIL